MLDPVKTIALYIQEIPFIEKQLGMALSARWKCRFDAFKEMLPLLKNKIKFTLHSIDDFVWSIGSMKKSLSFSKSLRFCDILHMEFQKNTRTSLEGLTFVFESAY